MRTLHGDHRHAASVPIPTGNGNSRQEHPLIGAVAYFPERYGAMALPLVMRWLNKEQVPPSNNTDQVLVTADNIDQYSRLS